MEVAESPHCSCYEPTPLHRGPLDAANKGFFAAKEGLLRRRKVRLVHPKVRSGRRTFFSGKKLAIESCLLTQLLGNIAGAAISPQELRSFLNFSAESGPVISTPHVQKGIQML